MGAVVAGAEEPDGGLVAPAGRGLDRGVGVALGEAAVEVGEELGQLLGQVVARRALGAPAQGVGGGRVGARGPADAEVDAPGLQGLQHPELLGDDEGRVVGQHHATGAQPDGRGLGRHPGQQDGGRRAGDARHRVVLGHPVAPVAEPFDLASQAKGGGQGIGRRRPLGHRGEVEDRERGDEVGHHRVERGRAAGSSADRRARGSTDGGCAAQRRRGPVRDLAGRGHGGPHPVPGPARRRARLPPHGGRAKTTAARAWPASSSVALWTMCGSGARRSSPSALPSPASSRTTRSTPTSRPPPDSTALGSGAHGGRDVAAHDGAGVHGGPHSRLGSGHRRRSVLDAVDRRAHHLRQPGLAGHAFRGRRGHRAGASVRQPGRAPGPPGGSRGQTAGHARPAVRRTADGRCRCGRSGPRLPGRRAPDRRAPRHPRHAGGRAPPPLGGRAAVPPGRPGRSDAGAGGRRPHPGGGHGAQGDGPGRPVGRRGQRLQHLGVGRRDGEPASAWPSRPGPTPGARPPPAGSAAASTCSTATTTGRRPPWKPSPAAT